MRKMIRWFQSAAALFFLPGSYEAHAIGAAEYEVDASFSRAMIKPTGGLVLAADGLLYGAAFPLFSGNDGMIYRYSPGGEIEVVHTFLESETEDVAFPKASLINMPDGTLWGVASSRSGGSVYSYDPASTAVKIIHLFTTAEGTAPLGRLLFASDGFVYGTTSQSGYYQGGSIFRIDPQTGSFETLWFFGSRRDLGKYPVSGLTEGKNGELYGVTSYGTDGLHAGSLFAFHRDWHGISLVQQFSTAMGNSAFEVTLSPNGLIYGVTSKGGTRGCGNVYSVRPNGKHSNNQHSFDCTGENSPSGPLLLATDGFFYGSTTYGGPLYRLHADTPDESRNRYSQLRSFHSPESTAPFGPLTESDGGIWGVTTGGGKRYAGYLYHLQSEGD